MRGDKMVKTIIYYFSGTGNSLHIAKCLKEILGECELLPIASLIKESNVKTTSEKVGFVFPVYTWALPKIVYEFIEKLDMSIAKYIFAVATMGGFSNQAVPQTINMLLEPKGKILDLSYNIRIFSNNMALAKHFNPLPSEKKIKKRIKKAELKLENIAELIKNNQKENTKKKFRSSMKRSYEKFLNQASNMDENFYSDDRCNGCGICENICPVDNIKLDNNKPEWQHRCEVCLGCINYCPQEAIQYGEHTINRERFNHPYIKIKELINQKVL
ncbi:MAG: 4Fe-4S ferredoxin [Candidatus Lokiarchaeota archaeon]|nr:4Fe-4S ferredoxin [Candidatus Lokiarchaeota archaeon]MBD3340166.1 4Fe-4S ferredoxin [Candidatus Lokiarchaeota archaeon]